MDLGAIAFFAGWIAYLGWIFHGLNKALKNGGVR